MEKKKAVRENTVTGALEASSEIQVPMAAKPKKPRKSLEELVQEAESLRRIRTDAVNAKRAKERITAIADMCWMLSA